MGQIGKLLLKLKSDPKDFTWGELKRVLAHYGYREMKKKGKTSGSRRKFVNENKDVISLHEPHPKKIIQAYVIKKNVEHLNL